MKKNIIALILPLIFSSLAWSAVEPLCLTNGQPLPVMNEQVLTWKKQTRNQYKNRALVDGTLANVYPDKSGHVHISVRIGEGPQDTVEVIYNESFGRMPDLKVGSEVKACGDYITSNARTKRYQPSPDGAIIHWVHRSNNDRHEDGFVMVDGSVYGL
jgi:hypothetical protein